MWTAKRVVILIASLLGILGGFTVYSLFLGVIDSLQALPPRFLLSSGPPDPETDDNNGGGRCDALLGMAFGTGAEELRRPIRYMFPEKGVVFAAGQFNIEKTDGRVRMAPFSVAIYHKAKSPSGYPEISTIKCDVAYLTFDRPVQQFSELATRKVEKIELRGEHPGISIINNRRTAEKSDDVDILVTKGSLFYEERQQIIYTDGVVRLTDYQSKPPTVICGRGLELFLAKDNGPTRPKSPKGEPAAQNNENNGGIEKLILRADVKMHFWVDSRSGFLTGSQPNEKPVPVRPAKKEEDQPIPPDKAQIHVQTGGMFVYDLLKEFAWFESPPLGPRDPIAPDHVVVQRLQTVDGGRKCDQVDCDRLDLQFRKKPGPEEEKEIETATATSRPEKEVVFASDTEHMAATGTYLFYRTGDANVGPLTVLKGQPCRAVKDGHVMHCLELRMTAANRAGEGQNVDAAGPGKVDFLDGKNPDPVKPVYPTHVHFRDKLTVVKDREGGQVFDLIKVTGNASFIDDQQKQELYGEEISVWVRQDNESAKKAQTNGGGKQEIHRVFAQTRVRARSPEYIIRRSDILTLTFLPEIARGEQLPAPPPTPAGVAATVPKKGMVVTNAAPPAPAPAPKDEKPRAPMELDAIEITIHSSTFGEKKKLQQLIAKGNVFVYQAGEKPGEKGLDIQGQLLTLKEAGGDAYVMVVTDSKKKARLETSDMILWGPHIMINQADNRAYVDGNGAMEMPSNTNLDGSTATKTDARITVHWNKNMTFDGKNAFFHGGVLAHQNDGPSRLLCQDMTAILDRYVSFKEPKSADKTKSAAKIDHILCDQKVYIDDVKLDDKKQLERRTILEGREAKMDNLETTMFMTGPGRVRTLGQSTSEAAPGPNANPPKEAAPKNAKPEWKLTRVEYMGRMASRQDGKTKTATFYDDVEVYHFPTIDILAVMDPNRPPLDGLYLRCGILTVETRQVGDKTSQYMIGQQNVFFRTEKYVGTSDIVRFDEKTDTVIFEALNGNRVQMSEIVDGKQQPMNLNSAKVLYNRKTGKMESDGVRSLKN